MRAENPTGSPLRAARVAAWTEFDGISSAGGDSIGALEPYESRTMTVELLGVTHAEGALFATGRAYRVR